MLRILAIVLMAGATVLNLLGGIGTFCVASNPMGWGPSMAQLASFQWLYILLMVAAIAVSIWGLAVTLALARGKPDAYRNALLVLTASMILAGVQTFASIALRGKGAPQNMRFYLTTLVLVFFLLLRLPPLWKRVGGFVSMAKDDFAAPAGLAAFWSGLIVLTTPMWAGPTHIGPEGAQWVDVIRVPLLVGGAVLALVGSGMLWRSGARPGMGVLPAHEARPSRSAG
jgi:hypothetical protein